MNVKKRVEAAVRRYFSGVKADKVACPAQAMLVIDIDYDSGWRPESVVSNQEKQAAAAALTGKITWARRTKIPVIFCVFDTELYKGTKSQLKYEGKCAVCDRESRVHLAEFLEHRHGSEFESVFVKCETDAFSNPELAKYLRSMGTEELLLAGCMTNVCVQATAKGAVRAGFSVNILREAVYGPFNNDSEEKRWIEDVRGAIPPGSSVTVRIS